MSDQQKAAVKMLYNELATVAGGLRGIAISSPNSDIEKILLTIVEGIDHTLAAVRGMPLKDHDVVAQPTELEVPCRDCNATCFDDGDVMVRCFVCGAYFRAPSRK